MVAGDGVTCRVDRRSFFFGGPLSAVKFCMLSAEMLGDLEAVGFVSDCQSFSVSFVIIVRSILKSGAFAFKQQP